MKKKLLFIIFLCITYSFYAQKNTFGKIPYTKVKLNQQKSTSVSILFNDLKPVSGTEFRLINSKKDASNKTHETYQQYYNGIKVEYGIIKVHQENGNIVAYNGAYFSTRTVQTSARIQKNQVIAAAKRHLGTSEVFWLPQNKEELANTETPNPELVILPNRRTGKINLAYTLNIGTSSPELRMGTVYVDAQTGTVLKYKNRLFTCFESKDGVLTHNDHKHLKNTTTPFVNGTAATAYSGSQSFETKLSGANYILNDETRATGSNWILSAQGLGIKTGIFTVDIRNSTNLVNPFYEFEDVDNNWTAAEMSSNEDQYALDVHWGSQVVYDYWSNERGRNSYNGNNSALMSIVHYDNNYTNAAWASIADDTGYMVYGDGAGAFTPLTTLDVVSHEIAHGITNATANLDYELESGAINEGLSDIWAIVIENYANTNYGTSKDISVLNEENGGGAIRSMANPNAYGQPDTYGGTYWYDISGCTPDGTNNDYCGVHTNSGVLNYWFWLLSQGGSGTNDLGNLFNTAAVGMNDAAAIVWQMQNNYLTATSDYADARTAGIQAAIDLFGTCSTQVESVTNAFYAVGIGDEYQAIPPTVTSVSSDVTIAVDETAQVTIEADSYDSIQWQISDDNGVNWANITDNSVYTGTATTTISTTIDHANPEGYLFRAIFTNGCGSATSFVVAVYIFEYTAIPDSNFETALEDLGYDNISGDNQVPTHLIEDLTSLNVGSSNIADLTGIEDFEDLTTLVINDNTISDLDISNNTNLTILNARNNGLATLDISGCTAMDLMLLENNNLTSLDLTNNTQLTRMWAQNNNFNSLDVSNSTLLRALGISGSNLTSLDLTNNSALQQLYAAGNSITDMDLSNNPVLRIISLHTNNLQSLNVQNGNNSNVTTFQAASNPNLTCILVDNASYSTSNWTSIDAQTSFVETSCYTTIPDANFEAALEALGYDDISGDGQVPTDLIKGIISLDIQNNAISDLTGIKDFTALQTLQCRDNSLTNLDVSNNTSLVNLYCNRNSLTNLELGFNTVLTSLVCDNNNLNTLDLSDSPALEDILISDNPINALDFSNNWALESITATNINAVAINLTMLPSLTEVEFSGPNIATFNLKNNNNTNLQEFSIENTPLLSCILVDDATYATTNWTQIDPQITFRDGDYCDYTAIPDANFEARLEALGYDDISGDNQVPTALIEGVTGLDISSQNISDVTGIEAFVNLQTFIANDNPFASLNLSANTDLEDLRLDEVTNLTSLDVSNNTKLLFFVISDATNLTSITFGNNTDLREFIADDSGLTSLDVSSLTALQSLSVKNTFIQSFDLSNNTAIRNVDLRNTLLTYLDVRNGNNTNIDNLIILNNPNLYCVLVDDVGYANSNFTLKDAQTNYSSTYCRYTTILDSNFETALENLSLDDISGDGQVPTALIEVVTTLDVSNAAISDLTGIEDFTALVTLTANNNTITTVDFSNNSNLEELDLKENRLTSINVASNANLQILDVNNALFSSIDLSTNTTLRNLYITNNINLTSIDLSANIALENLSLYGNSLSNITLGHLTSLETFYVENNALEHVNLSSLTALTDVNVSNNNLSSFDIRNGNNTNITSFVATNNTNLSCISVDDANYSMYNWTNIDATVSFTATDYCSYTNIPDSTFEAALESLGYDDISGDGQVPTALIEVVTTLNVANQIINDLTGIEDFTALENLDCNQTQITSLDLTQNLALKTVTCYETNIETINVSGLTGLEALYIYRNNLTNIDVSTNTSLTILDCSSQPLQTLNTTGAVSLKELEASANTLQSLDLTTNTALEIVNVYDTSLTSIDLRNGNNIAITIFNATSNPSLACINVDDAAYSTTNWTNIDASTSFTSTDFCRYTAIPDTTFEAHLESLGYDDISSDGQVPTALIEVVTSLDVSTLAISDLTGIQDFTALQSLNVSNSSIGSLDISGMPNLQTLFSQAALTSLDASDTPALTSVIVFDTSLTQIDVTNATALEELQVFRTDITDLDVSTNTALKDLQAYDQPLATINTNGATALESLIVSNTDISTLDISSNVALITLQCNNASLVTLDTSGLTALTTLNAFSNALDGLLDLSSNTNLEVVNVYGTQLSTIDIRNGNNTAISTINTTSSPELVCIIVDDVTYSTTNWTTIDAIASFNTSYCRYTAIPDANFETALEVLGYDDISGDNQVPTALIEGISSLDLNNNGISDLTGIQDFVALEEFQIHNDIISTIDLSSNTVLKKLDIDDCPITNLEISGNTLLEELILEETSETLASLDLSNNTLLKTIDITNAGLQDIILPPLPDLEILFLPNNGLTGSLNLATSTVLQRVALQGNNISDLNLQNGNNTYILSVILTDNPNLSCVRVDDAVYSTTNWTAIDATTSFSDTYCRYTVISDAVFEAELGVLGYDDISGDNQVPTALIENVIELDIRNKGITDLSGIEDFTALTTLRCSRNTLTTVDLTQNTNLEELYINYAGLTAIDLSTLTQLRVLQIFNNNLSTLDLTNNTQLTYIHTRSNQLTTIDLSNNPLLNYVNIQRMNLVAVNISNNTAMRTLIADSNELTTLDISNATALETLDVESNDISSITFGNNLNLTVMDLRSNNLTSLNLTALTGITSISLDTNPLTFLDLQNGNNTNITSFSATDNPNLTCILVDDATYSTTNWTTIDATTSFSDTYCVYTAIPDANFEAALEDLGYDDISGDNQVPTSLIENITSLDVRNKGISDLSGIEDFVSLRTLICGINSLTTLDVSNNILLETLSCENNSLTSINVSANINLEEFYVGGNQLTSLDISNNTELYQLGCSNNSFSTLDITNNTLLEELTISNLGLTTIDLSNQTVLETLNVTDNLLTVLDLSTNVNLETLFVDNNDITSLDLANNLLMDKLSVDETSIRSLDLSHLVDLTNITIEDNPNLTFVNLQNGENSSISFFRSEGNTNLSCMLVDDATYSTTNWTNIDATTSFSDTYCRYTQIPDANFESFLDSKGYDDISGDGQVPTALIENVISLVVFIENVSDFTGIEDFTALKQFSSINNPATTVDLSQNADLTSFTAPISSFTSLDFSNNPLLENLTVSNSALENLNLSLNPNLKYVTLDDNTSLTSLNIKNGNNTNISIFDTENTPNLTCISVDDATYSATNWASIDAVNNFTDAYCRYTAIPDANFETRLEALGYDDISGDGQVPTALIETVTFLDISSQNISDVTGIEDFTALEIFYPFNNNLTTINTSQNLKLELLLAESNAITSLDLSNNVALVFLNVNNNSLATIDLSANPNLWSLRINDNGLTALDVSTNSLLTRITCENNSLTEIDLSTNTLLHTLEANGNQLTAIDLSNNPEMVVIYVDDNNLSSLNVQNGNNTNILFLDAVDNPNLTCVLVDDASYSATNWTDIDVQTSFSETYCRYTQIPDSNFETVLENYGYDDISGDGQVPTALIENITGLTISNAPIADLTGIEDFINLQNLSLTAANLTDVNLSTNTNLTLLSLTDSGVTSLDISGNTALDFLNISNSSLTSLDLSNNLALNYLSLTDVAITALDLSENIALERFFLFNAPTASLNVQNGNNTSMIQFSISNTPNLTCVLVDDAAYSTTNWFTVDNTISFNETSCGNLFALDIKVFLQGAAFNPNTGEESLMRDDLRIAGYIPTRSPYDDMLTCEAEVFDITGSNAIVDWIWIELRDTTDNTIVSYSRSALLQRDGDIVDVDGFSTLNFDTVSNSYYVVVNHRSHLGIMSNIPFTFNATNSVDFTISAAVVTFGNNAQTTSGMPTGVAAMWCGNANSDIVVQYSGTSPDTPTILSEVLNDPGNFLNFPTYSVTGYNVNDINMDGMIQYSGTNPDTPYILQNVLAHPGNFLNFSTYQIIEQLPENN